MDDNLSPSGNGGGGLQFHQTTMERLSRQPSPVAPLARTGSESPRLQHKTTAVLPAGSGARRGLVDTFGVTHKSPPLHHLPIGSWNYMNLSLFSAASPAAAARRCHFRDKATDYISLNKEKLYQNGKERLIIIEGISGIKKDDVFTIKISLQGAKAEHSWLTPANAKVVLNEYPIFPPREIQQKILDKWGKSNGYSVVPTIFYRLSFYFQKNFEFAYNENIYFEPTMYEDILGKERFPGEETEERYDRIAHATFLNLVKLERQCSYLSWTNRYLLMITRSIWIVVMVVIGVLIGLVIQNNLTNILNKISNFFN